MPSAFTQVYLHLVGATWDRMALITPTIREPLYRSLEAKSLSLGVDTLGVGGVDDHVHMLVRFPTTLAIGDFVGNVKGASSHFVTHELGRRDLFRWQGGYGVFSLSRRGVPMVQEYIANQQEHHRLGKLLPALELTSEP